MIRPSLVKSFGLFCFCVGIFMGPVHSNASDLNDSANPILEELASCLTDKGWVLYGSFTCSACRVQRNVFGDASRHIVEVECNPHAPNTEVERCLKMKIVKTPTWILEKEGKEIKRIEGYQRLEDLAVLTGCSQ